ncbi:hypothetical protein [Streptomyces sp. NPDC051921]|uniref:hypothetical protein n=1 Tax=Streptomyces sp. NPDC051921 TaxID=3155806 RepID=UPI003446EB6D
MRRVAVAALVLGVLGTPATTGTPVTPVAPPRPSGYRNAPDATPVRAGSLLPGPGTYTDSVARGETRSYRVRLDGSSNVFLSAVLAPAPGAAVDVVDGVALSLRTASGLLCGMRTDVRLYGETARPVADYVSRRVEPGRDCQEAGEYDFVVEGVGRDGDAGRGAAWRWNLELGYVVEPAPGPGDEPPPLPPASAWSTDPPAGFGDDASGRGRTARGGTGFNDAAPLAGAGTWRDELRPGESRFYRVPVTWGQQLFARARFGNTTAPSGGSALPDGLRLALYNPARGAVDERKALYTGDPATLLLATAPAAYANRTEGATDAVSAMRFEGTYYLQVSLDRRAPGPVPLALDLALPSPSAASGGDGEPASGGDGEPASGGDGGSGPAAGPDSGPDSGPARGGTSASRPGPDPVLRAVGIAGISTGTALVVALAAWPLLPSLRPRPRPRPRSRSRPRGRHARGA